MIFSSLLIHMRSRRCRQSAAAVNETSTATREDHQRVADPTRTKQSRCERNACGIGQEEQVATKIRFIFQTTEEDESGTR